MIITEGVFSMDGDLAPVSALAKLGQEYDAWLLVDDAHAVGVIGEGRGSSFAHRDKPDVPLQMGTLSKAIGGYGGYVCASAAAIELIRNRARSFIYTTGLPPATVAAASAAFDIIMREPETVRKPVENAQRLTRKAGLPLAESCIVPVVVGSEHAALAAARTLEDEGLLVVAIRPPTVPAGTARLRLTFTAEHSAEDIDRLADIVRDRVLGFDSAASEHRLRQWQPS
jgi:8-amino-7-oxononanoate synthase